MMIGKRPSSPLLLSRTTSGGGSGTSGSTTRTAAPPDVVGTRSVQWSAVTSLIVLVTAGLILLRSQELQTVVNQQSLLVLQQQANLEQRATLPSNHQQQQQQQRQQQQGRHQQLSKEQQLELVLQNPLGIPPGKARNLPSIRVRDEKVDARRKIYGGAGDKHHLGGFTALDLEGISPAVWKGMITEFGVRSLMDVGCGRGISTLWFLLHGVDVLCAEGSHDAVERTLLPDPDTHVVEHDFSRGPWWPEKTYDAVWAVEFLEHVSRQYHFNYITAFRKAAIICVTSSRWGGWHHVEVHGDEWWIDKYESYGFRYSQKLTDRVKQWAREEAADQSAVAPNDKRFKAAHVVMSMKVFINPAVASLPRHAHLFPHPGCQADRKKDLKPGELGTRECGTGPNAHLETALPESFLPLKLTSKQDKKWDDIMRKDIAERRAEKEAQQQQQQNTNGNKESSIVKESGKKEKKKVETTKETKEKKKKKEEGKTKKKVK